MTAFFEHIFLPFLGILLLLPSARAREPECGGGPETSHRIHDLYIQQKWTEVVASAQRLSARSGEVDFELGMSLAHLERWEEARAALLVGRKQCPKDKRFPIELAGIAFQQKQEPDAAMWIRKGLGIDAQDQYANEFAGTVYLLMDNLDAALKYWNRIARPNINVLEIDPQLRTHRLLLERAFVFSPQSVMQRRDLRSSQARLDGLGIFPAYHIRLDARKDGKFDAQFHAIERNGFGNGGVEAIVSVCSGLPYETVYPSYFNMGRSATNLDSLLRWDAQKRRVWLSLSGPMHALPQWRWQVAVDGRDENWAIRSSFRGAAPVLGSFKLKREIGSATITSIRSGRFEWVSGAEFSQRRYSNVVRGSALTADLESSGFELKYLAGVKGLLDVPEHRFTLNTAASSELGRLWSNPARQFEKLQGGATLHWLPQAEGDRFELEQRVRGAGILGNAPVDELWVIGVERDTDLWLRGHIGTRDGRKGSSPVASRYLLSNSDFYRDLWSNGLISVKAGPLLDIARVAAPTAGLAPPGWLFDAGAEVKLKVLGTGVVFSYGRDLLTGKNAFYGSVVQH